MFLNKKLIAIFFLPALLWLLAGCSTTTSPPADSGTNLWKGHVIFAEIYTADWCFSCPLASQTMEYLVAEYGLGKLIITENHIQDDYSTAEIEARFNSFYGLSGIPTVIFDGVSVKMGAGQDYRSAIEARLYQLRTISLEVVASIADQKVTVSGSVSNEGGTDLSNLTINLFVVRDFGVTRAHYISRDITAESLSSLSAGEKKTFLLTSEVLSSTSSLAAVVLVQKSDKEVLQSIYSTL